ncbi:MAG: portal protein [Deltaproteobacteria bacterium]|nr:portal protein [Deltaproteobacteria bacterium]
MAELSRKKRYLSRYEALKRKREPKMAVWRALSEQLSPHRFKDGMDDDPAARSRWAAIINNTPVLALRTLAAGMMTGITSPARRWFRLTVADPKLGRLTSVREFLYEVERRMEEVFARSNIYNVLFEIYEDLGSLGPAVLVIDEDEEDVIRAYSLLAGTYCLAANSRRRVDTLYREVVMTVEAIEEKFGLENASESLRKLRTENRLDEDVLLLHVVEPDRQFDGRLLGEHRFPYRSVWLELEKNRDDLILHEGGQFSQPFVASRWAGDEYGYSPGMLTLGDAKGLQQLELDKAKASRKVTDPPMKAPDNLRTGRVSLVPGDITRYPRGMGADSITPAQVLPPAAITIFDNSINNHEERVNAGLYANLWVSLLAREGQPLTAREVAERHQEKLLQLGGVVERLNDELLDPLVDRVFDIMLRSGELPPAPPELEGMPLQVEYLSIVTQAQRMVGYSGVQEFLNAALGLAGADSTVADRVDLDAAISIIAEMLGVPPAIVRSLEAVEQIRQQRAQQQQQQRALEAGAQVAQSARDLGQVDMTDDNAASRLIEQLSPVAAAQVGKGQPG